MLFIAVALYFAMMRQVMRRCNKNLVYVVVLYPWNDVAHIHSGVPPYVAMLSELTFL